jgi:dolichyl-phosphate beta-glucosyltransferase
LTKPFLSIIIPAYNEENRLPDTLNRVFAYIEHQTFPSEILIVENGSTDRTLAVAEEFAGNNPHCRVLQTKRGKGLAVQRGMLKSQGEFCFMCDADLSMPVDHITHFLPPVLTDYEVAIGSREASGAKRFNEPFYRHWGGRLINLLIRALALRGMHDTQCGFKCFHRSVVPDLFGHQTMKGWSFDIELLYVAKLRGYRIVEVPIPWYYNPDSKLNVLKDAFRMAREIIQIRLNAREGVYDREQAVENPGPSQV